MQLNKSHAVLLLVSLVVLASGCADGGSDTTSKTAPLTVNQFTAAPDPVPADTRVSFRVELENTGDTDAERTAVRLGGPTFATEDDQPLTWRDSDGDAVSSKTARTEYFGTLRAPGDNNPSIPKTRSITLTSPDYPQGRESTDKFRLDIFYEYVTRASSQLRLMTQERFQETGATRTQPTLENTAGPIQLDIRGTTPKIMYDEDNVEELCIVVRNSGTGTPFISDAEGFPVSEGSTGDTDDAVYDIPEDAKDKVILEIQDVGNVNFDPKSGESDGNIALVELIDGEGFQCYEWGVEDELQQDEQTVNLQVEARYGYNKETSTTVTVEGRGSAPDTNDNEDSSDNDSDSSGVSYNWDGDKGNLWDQAEGDTATEKCEWLYDNAGGENPWTSSDVDKKCEES